MKKIVLSLAVVTGLLFFTSCGEKAKEEKSEKTEESAEETEEAEEVVEEATATCDQPMKDFMAMFNGSYTEVEAALNKFGAEGLDRVDMDMYDLKDPKVVACTKTETGECCTMEAGAGMTTRTYDICWTDGKISSIVEKGMK